MQPNIVFEMDAPKAARHHLKRLGENQTENGGGKATVSRSDGESEGVRSHIQTRAYLFGAFTMKETDLRKRIIDAGGMWGPSKKLWFLSEEEARKLGLAQRVGKQ